MNNINDNYLPSALLSIKLTPLNNMNIENMNNNIKNLILLSSNTDLNLFNKKKNKWVLKNKNKLLKYYEKIKKKELKSLEQIKKKELKELQQINNMMPKFHRHHEVAKLIEERLHERN